LINALCFSLMRTLISLLTTLLAALRSLLFQAWVVVTLIPMALFLLLCCGFTRWPFLYRIAVAWTRLCLWGGASFAGIRWRMHGLPHLQTTRPTVLLVKHQSTWETLA
jgi:1-acyl-sn-glycerol-3-phosphate acyltransferase